jgi:hypothetical protein
MWSPIETRASCRAASLRRRSCCGACRQHTPPRACQRPDAAAAKELRAKVSLAKASGPLAASALLGLRQDQAFRSGLDDLLQAAARGALPTRACADILWAVGAMHAESGALGAQLETAAHGLCTAVDQDLQAARPPRATLVTSLTDAVSALAAGHHKHGGTFQRLLCAVQQHPSLFQGASGDITCTLLWASSTLCDPGAGVTSGVAHAALGGDGAPGTPLSTWKPRSLALALWSLAAAELEGSDAFRLCWTELCARAQGEAKAGGKTGGGTGLSPLALTQVAQASFLAPLDIPPMPARLRAAVQGAWTSRVDAETRKSSRPSARQRQMEAALLSLGMRPTSEAVVQPHGYRVDFLVALPTGPVLIEYDGQAHFPRNAAPPCAPLGATRLKRRHLAAGGGSLVSVPFWEWESLEAKGPGNAEALRVDYLRKKLADIEKREA